ncbi:MAG: low-specificity L-threonine aldolase [Proteobacteria bacterium]|nr:low-specificity L-threonine aldolase [Pseudomonadota bacterium]
MIDLRSDTVTRPCKNMRRLMSTAEVGDDVYGDDTTVNKLEELAAGKLGKEAALFVPSGTQSNLIALLTHCQRGDEYIAGQHAHSYKYEGGGAAVLGSIQPQPLDFEADGSLDLDKVKAAIKVKDDHFANTHLLCIENTQGGKVLPQDYLKDCRNFVDSHQLALHLDGARLFNAAVKLGVDVQMLSQYFDSISICLSKGLGAPVGSVLCGNKEWIKRARRWRKMLGGGMRQAGILAAAGIYALENNVERLEIDHNNALEMANRLSEIEELSVDLSLVQTNMLFLNYDAQKYSGLDLYMKEQGILLGGSNPQRLVTHLDISSSDVVEVVKSFKDYFSQA